MLQNRENVVQRENLDDEQDKGPEQNPSLAELKDQRKEALSGGINKAGERVRGLGLKIIGILKRVGGAAEYILVAPEAAAGAAKFAHERTKVVDEKIEAGMDKAAEWTSEAVDKAGEGIKVGYESVARGVKKGAEGLEKGADAVDTAMDKAAYWTSAVVDKGVDKGARAITAGREFAGEKYESLGNWAKEKITGFQERGRRAVDKFLEDRKNAKERNQALKDGWKEAEASIRGEKRRTKAEMNSNRRHDKMNAEMEKRMARDEKNRARWQELQAMYGMSKEIQKLGVGQQEIMDKAA